ncbi:MAG: AraC family transcriptional regulator [Paracoccaceae bacterium]
MTYARHLHETSPAVHCMSLAQLARDGAWQLARLHDRPQHLLIWTTRGQGRVTIEGIRRGVSVHNALFLPAGTLFAFEIGAQGFGQGVLIPPEAAPTLPEGPRHLRIRDTFAQSECTGLLEAMQREQVSGRALAAEAMGAHASLLAVWLRRQLDANEGGTFGNGRETAAERLVRRYCRMVAQDFRSDRVMSDYAAALEVTPTHLTRVCKECCGLTAADILTERVLWEARSLLIRPEPAIQDIARHLGFSSAGYFTRFIQHHTGQTPSALRRVPARG